MSNAISSAPAFERYQEKPFIGSSHSWATKILLGLPRSIRILDIGSGSGLFGSLLKEHNFSYSAAVEIDSASRERTHQLYNRMESDLSLYKGEKFDVILLLDVLEHIPNFSEFFKSAVELVNPGGKLLISLPNVAHWSVRLPLLFGYFEYSSRGILDQTHFHFFNRRRALALINQNRSLKLIDYAASIPPLEFVLPKPLWDNPIFRALSRLHYTVAQLLPGFFGFQHLLEIETASRVGPN